MVKLTARCSLDDWTTPQELDLIECLPSFLKLSRWPCSNHDYLHRDGTANISLQDLSELQTSQIPVPTLPLPSSTSQPQQPLLLIRITHTSPTHVDSLYARGLHQNNHARLVHPPFTLGLEFTGIVLDTYPSVSTPNLNLKTTPTAPWTFQKGDKVWGAHVGCFAPYIICPATSVHHLPPSLSLAEAAGLGASTAPVSYGALVQVAGLKKGETVLVHAAAGGLGVAAVRIARVLGANVIGTVGSDEKARVVEDMLRGPDGKIARGCKVIRYDQEGWEKEVVKATAGGKGVDVVFDTVGLVQKSIRCCKFGGRIIIVGFVGLDGKMEQVAMNRVLLKGVKVFGYRFGETARQDLEQNQKTWNGLHEMLEHAQIKPVVYKTYKGLDYAGDALKELAARKVYGKVLIEITEEDATLSGNTLSTRMAPRL